MRVSENQMKMIAVGLIPVFLIITFALPKTIYTTILSGAVMVTGFLVCFLGMRKHDAGEPDDLLAIPPKKS